MLQHIQIKTLRLTNLLFTHNYFCHGESFSTFGCSWHPLPLQLPDKLTPHTSLLAWFIYPPGGFLPQQPLQTSAQPSCTPWCCNGLLTGTCRWFSHSINDKSRENEKLSKSLLFSTIPVIVPRGERLKISIPVPSQHSLLPSKIPTLMVMQHFLTLMSRNLTPTIQFQNTCLNSQHSKHTVAHRWKDQGIFFKN